MLARRVSRVYNDLDDQKTISENLFPVFLQGTHKTKGNKYIQSLPQEIRHKIWLEYAVSSLSYKELIYKSHLEVLKMKLEKEVKEYVVVKRIFDIVFKTAFEASNLDALKIIYKICSNNVKHKSSDDKPVELFSFQPGCSLFSYREFKLFLKKTNKNTIEVMDWLKSIQYPFDFNVYYYCVCYGRIDVIAWLHRNLKLMFQTTNVSDVLYEFFKETQDDYNFDDLAYIFNNFVSTEKEKVSFFEAVVENDNIEKLKFLGTNSSTKNVELDWIKLLIRASENNAFRCMNWIAENKPEYVNKADRRYLLGSVSHFLKEKNQKMIDWFYENIPSLRFDLDIFLCNFE